MSEGKKKSFLERLQEKTINTNVRTPEEQAKWEALYPVKEMPTTSQSQINKAYKGDYKKEIFSKSKEAIQLEKMQVELAEREIARQPAKGTLNETYKNSVQDKDKFDKYLTKTERITELDKKSLWSNLKMAASNFMDFGMLPGGPGAAMSVTDILWQKSRTKEEDQELNQLVVETQKEIRPYAVQHDKKLQAEIEKNKALEAEALKKLRYYKSKRLDKPGLANILGGKSIEEKKAHEEFFLLKKAVILQEDASERLQNFISGKDEGAFGIWHGLMNHNRDLGTLGIDGLATSLEVMGVATEYNDKVKEYNGDVNKAWESLTPGKQELLKAQAIKDDVIAQDLSSNSLLYNTADGTAQSLVFLEQAYATGGSGSLVRSGVQQALRGATKQVIKNTVKKSTTRNLGLLLTKRAVPAAAGITTQGVLSPSTYTSMAQKYTGNMELITDEEGNEKVLLKEGLYNKFMRDYETQKTNLTQMYKEVSSKENKSAEDEALLEKIDSQLTNLEREKDTITTSKDISMGKAFAYGFTQTAKELLAEKYVGRIGDSAGAWLANSKVGKYLSTSKVGKAAKYVEDVYTKGTDLVNKTSVGKLSSKALHHTGAGKLVNGIPGEIMEELLVQATPTLTENYMAQLEELVNPSFYADVVSQTLMMGTGFATLGTANKLVNFRKSKKDYNTLMAIRNSYKMMDKAITDEDLAETIIMGTGGTSFSQAEYESKITKLRQEKKFKEADKLEQKKFYNFALTAIQTGTLDEFEKALDKTLARANNSKVATSFSAATVNNIVMAKQKIEEIKSVYDKYKDRSNVGQIVELASQKITNKQSLNQLEQELLTQKELAREETEAFFKREKINMDFDTYNQKMDQENMTPEEEAAFESILDKLSAEDTPALNTYNDLWLSKEMLQDAHYQTMKSFNEQVSPQYHVKQQNIKGVQRQVAEYIQKVAKGDIQNPRAKFNEQNEIVPTKELIEDAFNQVDKMGLSQEEIASLKNSYFNSFDVSQKQRLLQELDSIAKRQQAKQENQEEPVATIAVTDGDTTTPSQAISVNGDDTLDIDSSTSVPATLTNQASQGIQDALGVGQNAPEDVLSNIEDNSGNGRLDDYVLNAPSLTEQQVNQIKGYISQLYKGIQEQTGKTPTFKEIVSHFIKYQGKEEAEKFFDAYKIGWEANNYAPTNYQEVYNDLFEPTKNIVDEASAFLRSIYGVSNEVVTNPTEAEVIVNSAAQNAAIEEANNSVTSFTEDNVPVKTTGNNRAATGELRLGYNAVKYEEVQQEDGTWVRVTANGETLNLEDSVIDFRDLLNPDMYKPGDTLNVAMAPENMWSTIKVNVGRDANNIPIIKTFAEVLVEKEKTNPDYRNSQEFIDSVPMFAMNSKGKPLAYIHDTSWYNRWNVADPNRTTKGVDPTKPISKVHADLIEDAKKEASELRQEIFNGNVNSITIEDKKEGPFFSRANLKDENGVLLPLYTIEEANPQAILAIQTGGGILEQNKIPFENNTRKIINKEELTKLDENGKSSNGHTWQLRRVGVDPKDGKQTYRAFKIAGRYPSEEQLETIKWAWSAYSFFDQQESVVNGKSTKVIQEVRNKFIPVQYKLTEEQARKIIKDVKDVTGYNLISWKDAQDFFKLYMQPKSGDSNAEFGRTIYSKTLEDFSQHTLNKALNSTKPIVLIKDGVVESTNKNYQDYLKSTLKTDVKSFNVGTEENPVYATSYQPTLTFSYKKKEVDSTVPSVQVAEAKKASLEVMDQILGTTDETAILEKARELQKALGFDFTEGAFAPPTIQGTSALESIFSLTPGLDLRQEERLVNFIYNFVSSAIDIKYKSKVKTSELVESLKKSYTEIVGPSRQQVETLLDTMAKMNEVTPSESLATAISNYQTILRTLENIETYWDKASIKAYYEANNMEYTGELGILDKAMEEVYRTSDIKEKMDTDEDLQNERDASQTEKSYNEAASLTESGKGKTTYRLRRFMSSIPKVDEAGNPVKGFLGLPEYLSYNEVYDTIFQLLGSGVFIESDYATMKAKLLEMKNANPWVVSLVEKFDNADEQLRKELVYNYRKHAVSMKFTMYIPGKNGTTLQVYDTNANEITRVITKTWKNLFKSSPLVEVVDNKYGINKEVAQKLLDERNAWGTEGHLQPDSVVRDWLSNFGLVFSDKYWEEIKTDGFKNGNKVTTYPLLFVDNSPISLLSEYLNTVIKSSDTNFEENDKMHPYKDMNAIIKSLSKGESRYTAKTLSKSFRDAGKNISGLTNPTYVTDRIDNLKRAALPGGDQKLITDLQGISLSSNSLTLELLLKDPDFASKFEINHLGLTALKEYGKKGSSFSSITDLNSQDHDITKMGMFQDTQQGNVNHRVEGFSMRIGKMFLPTMSDKSQMLTVSTGVFNFMEESQSAFTRDEEGQMKFTEDLRNLLYERLIQPEMRRIAKFHSLENGKTNIKDYDKAAQIFNFIPALNNVKDAEGIRVIKHLTFSPLEDVEAEFKEQLIDTLEEVLHSVAAKKKDAWSASDMIKFFDTKYLAKGQGSPEQKFEVGVYDYVLNYTLSNADMFTIVAGDPAIFSQDKLFKGQTEYPFDIQDDNFFGDFAKKQGVNIGKRLALLMAPGATLADSKGQKYKQIFLTDTKDISSNSDYLISLYYGKQALSEPLFDNSAKKVKDYLEEYPTLTKTQQEVVRKGLSDKFDKIGDYFDIEATDAQEYTTVKEHLYVLNNQGRITKEQMDMINDKLARGEEITKEDVGLVMQPIKPVATGQIIDKEQDVARTVYVKSSSFPLLPQLTAGTKLDALREKLEEMETKYNMPVRASYQTANKVGAMSTSIDPLNPEALKNIETAMLTMDRENFRIQQDVPFKSDMKKEDKIAMGTQFFKILFGDGMLNEGGFEFEGQTYTGQGLYDIYNKNFAGLVALERAKLFKELGLSPEGNVINEVESTKKLQDLLQKEAVNRDYPLKDIKGLEMDLLYDMQGNPYYEFKVPLWLSSNSNRYEALLNAIVTNRVMAYKVPGNSFVAGSENGFQFNEDLSGIEKSRIIFLNGFNGTELLGAGTREDGSFGKAQVFVPSKFKDSKGKLVDMFKRDDAGEYIYLETNDKGALTLKEGMIDKGLLENFSFRTPTSAHVSGSVLEIVGILPPECGDLMIVPKNFTKQKGLDFDVDKENAYQLNHVTDFKTGKIEELTEEHKNRATKKLEKIFETQMKIDEAQVLADFELAPFAFDEDFMATLSDETKTTLEKLEDLKAKFDQKILENKFIKVHMSIFSNPNPTVQQKINKVLSMSFAQSQADLIEGLEREKEEYKIQKELEAEDINPSDATSMAKSSVNSFTILSDEYQKNKMALGSAGKLAIGVYSNYVTFHALTQQTPKSLALLDEDGNVKPIVIGNQISDGIIGKETTLDGGRSIAEAFAERQNTATDNEKEQILGRVNINATTIKIDSILALLGFDKTTYTDNKGVKKDLSVSYALLSQPAIKSYVSLVNSSKGITAEFQKDAEEKAINTILNTYGNGNYIYEKGQIVPANLEVPTIEDLKKGSLTGDYLVDGIRYNGTDKNTQIAALATFLELKKYADNLTSVQSVLFTDNLGKSIVESNNKYEALKSFAKNETISNVSQLIGTFIPVKDLPRKLGEGYVVVGDFYVKPTTPQGQIVVNGLVIGQKLWSGYFPYNDPAITSIMESILDFSSDVSDFKKIEIQLEVIEEIKKFIFSWKGLGIYTETASKERARLFMDTGSNTSLAMYLNNNFTNPAIINNKLLNRFTYEVETNGANPSIIKYNNTISDNLDEKYLYNSLAEMIINPKELPDWNGKPFNTKMLAQELITYAYVEGGVQEAVQFIKYVPVEYLSEVGIGTGENFVSAATLLQRVNTKRNPEVFTRLLGKSDKEFNVEQSAFVKQYFQHNPSKAVKLDTKKYPVFGQEEFFYNEEKKPKFLVATTKSGKSKQEKNSLFQHVGLGKYVRIDVLGVNGMNEYDASTNNAKTILSSVEVKPSTNTTSQAIIVNSKGGVATSNQEIVQTGKGLAETLTDIANSSDPKLANHKVVAKLLLPLVGNLGTKVVVEKGDILGKTASGMFHESSNTIYVSTSYSTNPAATFIHELVHALSFTEIKKYYQADAKGFYTILKSDAPAHVVALNDVWKAYRDTISEADMNVVEQKTLKMRAGENTIWTEEELNMLYPAMDIAEFLSVVLESESFQKRLAETPYKGGPISILEAFKKAIEQLISYLNPALEGDNLAKASLSEALNFITSALEIKESNRIFAEASNSDLGLGNENLPELPPDDIDFTDGAMMPASVMIPEDPVNKNC